MTSLVMGLVVAAPADPGPTTLDLVTLAIAVFAAITSVAALVWQIASFRLTGARVKVDLKIAWLGSGGAAVGVPGTWQPGVSPSPSVHLECLAVHVRNEGRMPASITGWWVKIGPGQLGYVESLWNKPVPHRLDGGEENTWFVERAQVLGVARAFKRDHLNRDGTVTVRAGAATGAGKSIESKNSMTVPGRTA